MTIDVVSRFHHLIGDAMARTASTYDMDKVVLALSQEIRQEALEDAAKVCAEMAARNRSIMNTFEGDDKVDMAYLTLSGAVAGLNLAAQAIRALESK